MAEYRKIKKAVKLLKDANKELQEKLGILDFNKEDKKYLTLYALANRYSKSENVSQPEALEVCSSALKHQFIYNVYTKPANPPFSAIEYFDVNEKDGYDLLQGVWFIPTGLLKVSIKENSTVISILVAVVVAIATVINVIIEVKK
jgi:hypothetical protein